MKTHAVVIVLLFGFAVCAASAQAAQENGITTLPKATPSNTKPQADERAQKGVRSAETPSPQTAIAQRTVSPELEKSLAELTTAVTNLVNRQSKEESVSVEFLRFVKIAAEAGGALLGVLVVAIGLFHKTRPVREHMPVIVIALIGILLAILLLASLYLLSGLVTAVLNAVIAVIILFVALLVAAAHLLTFIDKNEILKNRILDYSSGSSSNKGLSQP